MISELEAKQIVAANVSALLERRGLTQRDLGRMAKMNDMAVSRLVRGEVEPTAAILANVAEALSVTVDFLLGKQIPQNRRTGTKTA